MNKNTRKPLQTNQEVQIPLWQPEPEIPEGMRMCRVCEEIKPLEDFRKMKGCVDGRMHKCKKCDNKYFSNRYHTNPRQKAIQKWHGHANRTENYIDQETFVAFMLATTHCDYCGDPLTPIEANVDHRIPVVSGGVTSLENLARTCQWCNNAKGKGSEADYLAWLERRKGASRVEQNPEG